MILMVLIQMEYILRFIRIFAGTNFLCIAPALT